MEERGIEHCDVWNSGQQLSCHLNCLDRRGIMQRGQLRELLELDDHRIVHQRRQVKPVAAVDYSVPYRHQLAVLQVEAVVGEIAGRRFYESFGFSVSIDRLVLPA